MDFDNIEIGEDLSEVNNQADRDAWQAEQIARMNKESMQKFGVKPISTVQLPRVAANPVTQTEYNTRLYSILKIIENPELANERYPLATTWKKFYKTPYNDKATNWKISKKDAATIIAKMKEEGVYKRFRMDGVASIIAVVKDFHKTMVIKEQAMTIKDQEDRLKAFELMLDPKSTDIYYRGHHIKRLTRKYSVKIAGLEMTMPHNAIDKMFAVFAAIDAIEDTD